MLELGQLSSVSATDGGRVLGVSIVYQEMATSPRIVTTSDHQRRFLRVWNSNNRHRCPDDQNTITIMNTGSETVDLSHIFLTLSDTSKAQGTPFTPFVNHYSGSNLYLFPGEQLSTDAFPLDPTTHGFSIDADPDRAFLAIYDYNDAGTVTIT